MRYMRNLKFSILALGLVSVIIGCGGSGDEVKKPLEPVLDSLIVSTGNGSKNLYISGDGNVIVTAQVDSENWYGNNDSESG